MRPGLRLVLLASAIAALAAVLFARCRRPDAVRTGPVQFPLSALGGHGGSSGRGRFPSGTRRTTGQNISGILNYRRGTPGMDPACSGSADGYERVHPRPPVAGRIRLRPAGPAVGHLGTRGGRRRHRVRAERCCSVLALRAQPGAGHRAGAGSAPGPGSGCCRAAAGGGRSRLAGWPKWGVFEPSWPSVWRRWRVGPSRTVGICGIGRASVTPSVTCCWL